MSTTEMSEMEKKERKIQLKQIEGTAKHIEINDKTLVAYREEFRKKGLEITKEEDYPKEDFHMVAKQRKFDTFVDPSQGIRKVIESMVRMPITIFDKNGKPQVRDALYYNGYWYGTSKRGEDLGAPFHFGSYKKPKLGFVYRDAVNPYDPKTGERRGQYKPIASTYEYYIFLSEDKKERRKQLEDIIQKAIGTHKGNLEGGHLHYRNPSANNDRHQGYHGGSFTWDLFCDLSIEQLAELQQKRYYTDDAGIIRDATGQRVAYDPSAKKVEISKDR
jgi:hypothetical protein